MVVSPNALSCQCLSPVFLSRLVSPFPYSLLDMQISAEVYFKTVPRGTGPEVNNILLQGVMTKSDLAICVLGGLEHVFDPIC
jgi:hypothetical protein